MYFRSNSSGQHGHFCQRAFLLCAAVLLSLVGPAAAYATTATESVIYTFSPFNTPSQLIQAHDGNFYGTAPGGGTGAHGFVFRLSTAGTQTVIYNFTNGTDGGAPLASLIEGNDGNLYGTNTSGGSGSGVLFRMTLAGAITTLHTFASATDGSNAGQLIQNTAGDIFGAATNGGASSAGTVFEYSHLSVFSLVHTFTGASGDGSQPNTQLIQATDGLIYGATRRGGSLSNSGSLFRFNPASVASFATYASFPPTNLSDPDYNPAFGLTEGEDGALYGLTAEGGTTGYGTVYKVVPGATPTVTLNHFNFTSFSNGGLPASGLFLGGDGALYGTTSAYGPGGPPNGTVFQYLPSTNTLNVLYSFSSPNGNATGAPIQAADGELYGPASAQIYKLVTTPSIPAPVAISASPSIVTVGTSFTLDWIAHNVYSETMQDCYAHGSWSGSKAISGTQTITPTAAGTYTYSLTCGGIESASTTVTVHPATTGVTATPVITPASGSFTGPVEYNITDASSGAVIHYTTNGTTPTLTSPVWDNVPKVIVANTVIQAIAIASPLTVSSVAEAKYAIAVNSKTNCSIAYPKGFVANSDLILNHTTSISGTTLDLTHGLQNENNSAFAEPRIPVSVFATEFHFLFAKATPTSGDGITFTVQASSFHALGGPGGALGYQGIPNSLGLKFDLHNNSGEGINSVGLYFGGAAPTVPSVDLTPSGINLHSGHIMDAYVTYDSHHLVLNLKDTVTAATFTHTWALPTTSPFGATSAYAGFTSSTGVTTSYAQILDWTLESEGVCGPK